MVSPGSILPAGAAASWSGTDGSARSGRCGSELIAGLLIFAATCFNCMLCLIDTRLFAIPQTFVILCEVVIVATTLAYSVAHWNAAMTPMALLLLFSAVLWLVVSLLAQAVNLMIIRDMMIPPVFMMLGIASAHNRLPRFRPSTCFSSSLRWPYSRRRSPINSRVF